MAVLRLFAAAREAAGTGRATFSGATVGDVLEAARARFGDRFGEVLDGSKVWVNGDPADPADPVSADDEVAVLPPVSGGADSPPRPRWAPPPGAPTRGASPDGAPGPSGASTGTGGPGPSGAPTGTGVVPGAGVAPGAAVAAAAGPAPVGRSPARVAAAPRLTVVHDTAGPRVRLGVLWFAAAILALAAGHLALGLLFAVVAACAADQLLRLRAPGPVAFSDWVTLPMRLPTALAAAALPLAAVAGPRTFGAAVPAVVLVVLGFRLLTPTGGPAVLEVAHTLTFALAVGFAAAAPVLAYGFGPGAAFVLVLLVSVYDAGDFIVGSGAGNAWEGPAAGVAAVLVFAFALAVVAIEPIGANLLLPALAVCVLAPLGPPAASVLIGDGRTPAGFVRRLDSLLVLGPLWVWLVANIVL